MSTVQQTAANKQDAKSARQLLQPARGTHDLLPETARRFRHIEETALDVFGRYGFGEIRTPIFEFTEIFSRNVGDSTDIVTKEMYNFEDRGGESLTLRPEGTAPVVRAYYSNGMKKDLPLKVCYVSTPMFRYERPQKGRMRQHHQVGAEIFGIADPMAEVELLSMAFRFLTAIGVGQDLYVELNSLGDQTDRMRYREALLDYLRPHADKLSEDSKIRLERNPLRVLDSKAPEDIAIVSEAPQMHNYLSEESTKHFDAVKTGLDALGIKWKHNPNLVRGLDYYSHTVFEVHSDALGAQSQVLSGGRYNGLIGQMGGDDVPAIGFGSGMERLEALMPALPDLPRPIAIVAMGENARNAAIKVSEDLRAEGHTVAMPLEETSFKSQFKKADKANANWTIIIGEDEVAKGECGVKNMETGDQTTVPFGDVVAFVSKK